MKPRLRKNYDTTALIAPSSPDHLDFPVRFGRAIVELKKLTENIIPPTTFQHPEFLSVPAKDRVEEFYAHLENKKVDLMMSISGGYNCIELLDLIDYDRVASCHKPLIGYSDFNALQIALYCRKGLVSFYGPAVVPCFGEYPSVNQYTLNSLKNILQADDSVVLQPSSCFSESNYFWDREDVKAYDYRESKGWNFIGNGEVEGKLFGGNLDTLLALAGSTDWISDKEIVLFFEEAYTTPKKLIRSLHTLTRTGILKQTKGILIGRCFCPGSSEKEKEIVDGILSDFVQSNHIPAVLGMDFGHDAPMMTLPIGIEASVDFRREEIVILEPTVDHVV